MSPYQNTQAPARHGHWINLSSLFGPPPAPRWASSCLRAFSKSHRSAANERFSEPARPMITKSCPALACSLMIWPAASRSRRRTLLRTTALPTLRLTVKPTRKTSVSPPERSSMVRVRAWSIRPGVTHLRRVRATRRKSARRFKRKTAGYTADSSGQAFTSPGAPPSQDPAAGHGRHAGAEAVAALADKPAWLKGTLHGVTPTKYEQRCIRSCPIEVNAG